MVDIAEGEEVGENRTTIRNRTRLEMREDEFPVREHLNRIGENPGE